ncbi:beta-propeller fold lactonase family protein, partial [Streptomyces sp. MBT56]|nr:beta-propeller fold lactonase family protein [Streptomyces sp. MBT56]
APSNAPRATRPLLLGTYTSEAGGGAGIGTAAYDTATGAITPGSVITGVDNPSYLALHPSGSTVYAVAEQDAGAVTAVRLAPDGTYEVLGSRPTGGSGTTHLSVHPSGRWLLSANYGSGSVAVHPVAEDGALGERTDLVTHSSPPPGPHRPRRRPCPRRRPGHRHRVHVRARRVSRDAHRGLPRRPGARLRPPPPGLPSPRALRLPGLRAGQHPGRLRVRPRHRRPHPGARAVHRYGIRHQLPLPAGRHRRRRVRLPRQPGPQQPHPLRRGRRRGDPAAAGHRARRRRLAPA